jgi:hypothetical protein
MQHPFFVNQTMAPTSGKRLRLQDDMRKARDNGATKSAKFVDFRMGLAHSDQVAALDSVSLRDGETVLSAVLQRQLPYAERLGGLR